MSRLAFITSALLAVRAAAQASHANEGFQYVGCVEADTADFPLVIDFFAPFTPEQCQTACSGSATFAALGSGCFCDAPGLGEVDFTVVDEAKCDNLCIADDESKGNCGGTGVFNLYKKDDTDGGDDGDDDDDEDCEEEDDDDEEDCDSSTHGGHGHTGHYTKTETNVHTVTSCPPEVPDCPAKPTYTKPPTCDGNCPDETTPSVPTVTPTNPIPCPGCDGGDGEGETASPTRPPVVTAAAGQNAPAMGAVALGALFLGML